MKFIVILHMYMEWAKEVNPLSANHYCSRQQILQHLSQFSIKIRYDIKWESSQQTILMKYALLVIFEKSGKIWNCRLLQIKGGTLRVNWKHPLASHMTMMVSMPIKSRNPLKVFSRAEKITLDRLSDIFFIGYSILLQSFTGGLDLLIFQKQCHWLHHYEMLLC